MKKLLIAVAFFFFACSTVSEILTIALMPLSGTVHGKGEVRIVCGRDNAQSVNVDFELQSEVRIEPECDSFYIELQGESFYGRSLPLNFYVDSTPVVFVVEGEKFYPLPHIPSFFPVCVATDGEKYAIIVEKHRVAIFDLLTLTSNPVLDSLPHDVVTCGTLKGGMFIVGGVEKFTLLDVSGNHHTYYLPEPRENYLFLPHPEGILLAGGVSEGEDVSSTLVIRNDGTFYQGPFMRYPRSNFRMCKAEEGYYIIAGGRAEFEVWNFEKFYPLPLKKNIGKVVGIVCSREFAFVENESGEILSVDLNSGDVSLIQKVNPVSRLLSVDESEGGLFIGSEKAIRLPGVEEFPVPFTSVSYISGFYMDSGIVFVFTEAGGVIQVKGVSK